MRPTARAIRSTLTLLALLAVAGCANRPPNPLTPDLLVFVPGAAGDGAHYDGLIRGLREGGVADQIHAAGWGMPGPLFVMNFQDDNVHRAAERKLADFLVRRRAAQPDARIDLVAHSAGCGVVLGALALADAPSVGTVALLNPSVSPGYDLRPALEKVAGRLHVFHSDEDRFFLSWRTGTFGTYDNVRTKAAGHTGFRLDALRPDARGKVAQHPRDDTWLARGNDGSHFGTVAQAFARETIAPLLIHRSRPPATDATVGDP
jgi:alpha-beta hydrolase superfamily lysophospholipase